MFAKLDFNNNGTIDYSEFLVSQLDPAMIVNEERLRKVFDIFDLDKSGAITVDEIKILLGGNIISDSPAWRACTYFKNSGASPKVAEKNEVIDDAEWAMILSEVDVNGDGEISFEEFL